MTRRLLIFSTLAATLVVGVVAWLTIAHGASSPSGPSPAADANGVPVVSVAEVQHDIARGAVVLDVRKDDEWAAGRLAGSVHIPLADVQDRYPELPKNRMVVTVCKEGGRSYKAAYALRQLGYNAVNLDGGLTAWAAAGLPIVGDNGGAGHIL